MFRYQLLYCQQHKGQVFHQALPNRDLIDGLFGFDDFFFNSTAKTYINKSSNSDKYPTLDRLLTYIL